MQDLSRLESNIRRLIAQRACLNHGVALAEKIPGPFLELGLGNGRSFDHLREIAPSREIFVFERRPQPHPECMPDSKHLIVGDLESTLIGSLSWLPQRAAMIHSDIGTGDIERNERIAEWLSETLPDLVACSGIVISDQPLTSANLRLSEPPEGDISDRYFLYCRI